MSQWEDREKMGDWETHVPVGLGQGVGGHCDRGYVQRDEERKG